MYLQSVIDWIRSVLFTQCDKGAIVPEDLAASVTLEEELEGMTKAELMAFADEHNIVAKMSWKKVDIIEAILQGL